MATNRSGTAGAPGKGAPARPALPGGRFSGNGSLTGQLVKIALLGLFTALGVWAVLPLYTAGNWWGIGLAVAVVALVYWVYLSKRTVPAKYLVPGVLFLMAFQIFPVLYTMSTSLTNMSDGHRGSKEQAISSIEAYSVVRGEDSEEYVLTVATTGDPESGELVFLLTDSEGDAYAGTEEGLSELERAEVGPSGKVTDAFGYTLLTPSQVNARSDDLQDFAVPTGDGSGIRSSGLSSAFEGNAQRAYDEACDCVTDSETGKVYTADDERGAFYGEDGERLAQGWQVGVGFDNFARFLLNPTFAASFFSTLVWNIAFAASVTFLVFVLGLAVALTLHVPRMRGKVVYRILVVLPYAMSSLAMYLLWRDMFNADFGLFNRMLGLQVDWLGDAWAARAAVILANVWLGYPYMFLVATGALQAIPRELGQAAQLDGAGPWQAFRHVTLPLLMVAMAPILIATFAFNFNNFNAVWLLTRGGPFGAEGTASGGATDLLITYTYRLAFSEATAQYGYAAALSVMIFLIVSVTSVISLSRTKALQEVDR
ncbi:sugar ABC transporter permease [Nocardiopsis terrae]|uniref:Maltose/maltodextrin transport system permease protein n=1 Tax=Nocardiopsis terrae TaxID=372655 RepID=A0ABR9HK21_9ACTN|nr:ABC transporter permease subunit [Nocardiopsis terrae]MBE1459362.1 arabinogalactan oligomer/maltooligosaccharide transport system permease protein [Nocardiopsis terrae]GHC96892.1 sugar ABC transporter permease [Nocardiopsis terrae]